MLLTTGRQVSRDQWELLDNDREVEPTVLDFRCLKNKQTSKVMSRSIAGVQ